ncbi:PspC domain-containing protein [Dethiothermospora halolimnae]|uniref:PspC domain-containing protein n=1 Tax=Dethiothermospora halolimnae TaxID=3114390 RepID=UPI003CCC42FA
MKKIFRSSRDKMIGGVCGGISEYFNIDSTFVRIFWALLTLGNFFLGVVGYIICLIFIPEKHNIHDDFSYDTSSNNYDNQNTLLLGGVLIVIGLLIIIKRFVFWFSFFDIWPVLLIVGGFYIILKKR